MLQIDHIYKFFFNELFTEFEVWFFRNGIPNFKDINESVYIFSIAIGTQEKMILFFPSGDQASRQYVMHIQI